MKRKIFNQIINDEILHQYASINGVSWVKEKIIKYINEDQLQW